MFQAAMSVVARLVFFTIHGLGGPMGWICHDKNPVCCVAFFIALSVMTCRMFLWMQRFEESVLPQLQLLELGTTVVGSRHTDEDAFLNGDNGVITK